MVNSIFKRWSSFILLLLVFALSIPTVMLATAQESTVAQPSFAEIYNQVSPSVVAISVEKQVTMAATMPGLRQQQQAPQIQRGLGSGFVLDTNGYIVTNDHVVDGATSIEVAFNDGTLARADVVGTDPNFDIAVIHVSDVSADHLYPITFADSDSLFVGQTVLAIGSPFGERWTLTSGIISGLDRIIQGLTDFSIGGVIQTDAAINPGNSGGPLLNLSGEVVGMNSQIVSASGSSAGIGFAIPSNLVQRAAQQLIDQGYVEYSYLGISGGDVTLDAIEALGLPNDTRGILVNTVNAGGPAARADLHAAVVVGDSQNAQLQEVDIITSINGHELYGMADLISYLARDTQPGDTVTLSVLRNGTDTLNMEVHLTPRPSIVQS
ncbi:MAG: trypsin-like peptidase domain-containing protein [Anaerolineae bacterium]|nr:trypsin-like peptidase domain-containing protein [Anaerolineae bacterium]